MGLFGRSHRALRAATCTNFVRIKAVSQAPNQGKRLYTPSTAAPIHLRLPGDETFGMVV
jgi:hypothetical protein